MNRYLFILFVFANLWGCNSDKEKTISVIPQPSNVKIYPNTYSIKDVVLIQTSHADEKSQVLAEQLSRFLVERLSVNTYINSLPKENDYSLIILSTPDFDDARGEEHYSLTIDNESVEISANSNHGLFNGIQTFKQLSITQKDGRKLPQIDIQDQPSFSYRGMMLDVSRHFFTVEEVKRFLDLMSFYKFNKFHWHLTDDQGWRIEIKQYPLLTDVGSYRPESMLEKNYEPFIGDGIPHSGFYTQDQIQEVVAYAAQRHIEVIPEIEMPGHAMAALAAYPELGCFPINYQVSTSWWESFGVMCPKESTFDIIENILDEVIALFPSEYVHIGGDEVAINTWQQSDVAQSVMQENNIKDEHALQGYFFDRVSQYLATKNKRAIGWDEILEKNVQTKPTVMIWRDLDLLLLAEQQKSPVILTPGQYTYFDYYQGDSEIEPLAQCCYLPVDQVYKLPIAAATSYDVEILGGQGQLWTAFIKTESYLQYMALPRMLALSEALWSLEENKNYNIFKKKTEAHQVYLETSDINYFPIP